MVMDHDGSVPRDMPGFFTDPNVRFPTRPCLLSDIDTFQMPNGLGFQFRGASSVFVIRGRESEEVLTFLLSKLDGTRTVAELLEECPPAISRSKIIQGLRLLHTKGALKNGEPSDQAYPRQPEASAKTDVLMQRQLLFWGRKLNVTGYLATAAEVQDRLRAGSVILIGTALFGAVTYDLLRRSGCEEVSAVSWDDNGFFQDALVNDPISPSDVFHLPSTSIESLTLWLADRAKSADLVLQATRNAPAMLMRSINRVCLDAECPYVRANEDGHEFELGPYVLPYRSACYTCMELRESSVDDFMLEEALYHEDLARERPAGQRPPQGESLISATLGASLLASEAVRILSGISAPTLLNSVIKISTLEGTFQTNRILRVPRCTDCSRGPSAKPGAKLGPVQ
jgi:bacteriocin biosynthesis cyclodehydratase domain-containing protein